MIEQVRYYGCVRCQRQHFEDTAKALFEAHIMHQSKHGIQFFAETLPERAARYGIPMDGNQSLLDTYSTAESRESGVG